MTLVPSLRASISPALRRMVKWFEMVARGNQIESRALGRGAEIDELRYAELLVREHESDHPRTERAAGRCLAIEQPRQRPWNVSSHRRGPSRRGRRRERIAW